MKRILIMISCLLGLAVSTGAQNMLNDNADSILGVYQVTHQGENTKVELTKDTDGTYRAQVIWVESRLDSKGNVRLDEKNPDKSLRHVECDKIVLMTGLRYDPDRKRWGDTKVYDPTRGLRANVVCMFQADGSLRVKGSLLGFSQSMFWKKLEE